MRKETSAHAESSDFVLTVSEAAEMLKVSENHLYNLISQKLVPHFRAGKLIRIPRWGLLQFIAAESGVPLPANLEVAFGAIQSVHVQQPDEREADHGER